MKIKATLKEDGSVEFLKVTFKSIGHYGWFQLSMTLFLGMSLFAVIQKSPIPFAGPAALFGLVSLFALIATKGGQKKSRMFSNGCIWWNLLLSVVNFILFVIAFRLWYFSPVKH